MVRFTHLQNIRAHDGNREHSLVRILKGFSVDFFHFLIFLFFFYKPRAVGWQFVHFSVLLLCWESCHPNMHTYPSTWFNCFFLLLEFFFYFFMTKRLKLCEQFLTSPLSALDFLLLTMKCCRFFSFSMVRLQLPYLPVSLKNRWKFFHKLMNEETLGRAGDKWSTQVPV